MTAPPDYRKDLREASRCVGEMLRLVRALPDGLDRLRAFTATPDFWDWREEVSGGVVMMVPRPNARTREFVAELRRLAGAGGEGRAA